jgi:hypothetical protein
MMSTFSGETICATRAAFWPTYYPTGSAAFSVSREAGIKQVPVQVTHNVCVGASV